MSEIKKTKDVAYDHPEVVALPAELSDVYEVIDAALDNGELSYRTLEQACKVGQRVLQAYAEADQEWMIYAELTPQVRVERSGELTAQEINLSAPTNIYGEVQAIELRADGDERAMLAATVESIAIGQYDRYIVPLAYHGDTQVQRDNRQLTPEARNRLRRPVDLPLLLLPELSNRQLPGEQAITDKWWDRLAHGISADDLIEYIHQETTAKNTQEFNDYMTAINLDIDDMLAGGQPYRLTVHQGSVNVYYEHGYDDELYYGRPNEQDYVMLSLEAVRDHTHGQVHDLWVYAASDDGDQLVAVRLSDVAATIMRDGPAENDPDVDE